jgi:iron complex transport system permease protein
MQALTRNPLADPGLLGINAGAGAAVVTAISFLGIGSIGGFPWSATAWPARCPSGENAVDGGRGATPARLALAGVAGDAAFGVGRITRGCGGGGRLRWPSRSG